MDADEPHVRRFADLPFAGLVDGKSAGQALGSSNDAKALEREHALPQPGS